MIDDFQIFVMSSFRGSAFVGDILDKKWVFDNAYLPEYQVQTWKKE